MSEKQLKTPVCIIGAGPAGWACSAFLSKAGISHCIIDKASFPRDKVCGDAISGKSVYVIRTASETWLEELLADSDSVLPSTGLRFIAPNGATMAIPFGRNAKGQSPGFTTSRLHFDQFLFNRLHAPFAKIVAPADLKSILRQDGSWQLQFQTSSDKYQLQAELLVAADGDKSQVRKLLGLQDTSAKTSAVGLRAYYSGIKGLGHQQIELHFLPELLPGYFWIFPLPNGKANVGAGMMSQEVRDKKINLRERMLKAIENNPALKDRFSEAKLDGKILGWGLPMGMKQRALSGEGYLLTGDAAQLIDPFSGEGIGNALYSGMRAAKAIEEALKEQNFSASFLKEHYDTPLYHRLWGELRTSIVLQYLCKFPWLFNFVVRKANKSPTLKTTITGMFTDLDLRKQLRQPGFYLKMLFNR